jgi:hypothetical protein
MHAVSAAATFTVDTDGSSSLASDEPRAAAERYYKLSAAPPPGETPVWCAVFDASGKLVRQVLTKPWEPRLVAEALGDVRASLAESETAPVVTERAGSSVWYEAYRIANLNDRSYSPVLVSRRQFGDGENPEVGTRMWVSTFKELGAPARARERLIASGVLG